MPLSYALLKIIYAHIYIYNMYIFIYQIGRVLVDFPLAATQPPGVAEWLSGWVRVAELLGGLGSEWLSGVAVRVSTVIGYFSTLGFSEERQCRSAFLYCFIACLNAEKDTLTKGDA